MGIPRYGDVKVGDCGVYVMSPIIVYSWHSKPNEANFACRGLNDLTA